MRWMDLDQFVLHLVTSDWDGVSAEYNLEVWYSDTWHLSRQSFALPCVHRFRHPGDPERCMNETKSSVPGRGVAELYEC